MKLDRQTHFVASSSSHRGARVALANSEHLPDTEAAAHSLGRMAEGMGPASNPVYARLHNETVAEFEAAMACVEHTPEAVAFGCGMAAMTAVLLAARMRGGHVVAVRPLYGCTDHLLASGLTGLDVTWATPDKVKSAVRPDTVLVVAETPANPTLQLVDIAAITEAAGSAAVLIDSTFATPVLQNPSEQGARLVLHSASKYIGGHGDVLGGVVACDEDWAASLRQVRIATGGVLHPWAAYLLRRGLATLPVRIEAAQKSAMEIARRLRTHPRIKRIYYPGLAECDRNGLVGRQMRGPGAMIAFEMADKESARQVMERVEVITAAVSLGSTDSLIQHPASLTHQIVCEQARDESGISDGLLRMSVGLEALEDLWADLEAALSYAIS